MYVTAARRCIQYYLSTYQNLHSSTSCREAMYVHFWVVHTGCAAGCVPHARRAPATAGCGLSPPYVSGIPVRRAREAIQQMCCQNSAAPERGDRTAAGARGSTSTSASPARQPLRRRALQRQRRRCRETAPPRRGRGTAAFMLGAHPLRARAPDAPATSPARAAETAQALHRRRRRGGPEAPPRARGSPSKG